MSRYAIVTAAYNEEAYIETAIRSIIDQTHPPERWVIVSDGSTDRTDEIAKVYAQRYPFIQLHRITEEHDRNWSAQVYAINSGFAKLEGLELDYVGNLDADISLEPDYFERLTTYMDRNPDLGISGGFIWEAIGGGFRPRPTNTDRSVPHAVQLFRRCCFESVRPYTALPYGGPDWYAEILARMHGWRVQVCRNLRVNHHRPTGTAGGFASFVRYWYRQGWMDHTFGTIWPFELVKIVRRLPSRPFVIGALARLFAYTCATVTQQKRLVPDHVIRYLRQEQKDRLRSFFHLPMRRTIPIEEPRRPPVS